jgi:protein involved in ribonucleotide reduction
MQLVYLSLTGNIRKFVEENLGVEDAIELSYSDPLTEVNEDYILIVPSYDDETTDVVCEFIDHENNLEHLVGVVGSGNTNFDDGYCFSAKEISKKYNKPLIFCFEFSGTETDIINFKKEVEKVEIARTKQEG